MFDFHHFVDETQVDLFPTFIDLAGLPSLPADQHIQGVSLRPILVAPPATGSGFRPYAFSQFAKGLSFSSELQRRVPWGTCTKCNKHAIDYMGYSIRSDRWRLTEWVAWDGATLRPEWGNTTAEFADIELYDHAGDFGADFDKATAKVNLAKESAYAAVVANLTAELRLAFNNDHEPPH